MNVRELSIEEVDAVAGGPGPLLAAFWIAAKGAKLSATMKAAAFGVGGAAAVSALDNDN